MNPFLIDCFFFSYRNNIKKLHFSIKWVLFLSGSHFYPYLARKIHLCVFLLTFLFFILFDKNYPEKKFAITNLQRIRCAGTRWDFHPSYVMTLTSWIDILDWSKARSASLDKSSPCCRQSVTKS